MDPVTQGVLGASFASVISNKKNLKLLKYGIDEKNLEATAFAWFAFARNNQVEFKKSNITGAKRTYFLGNIY